MDWISPPQNICAEVLNPSTTENDHIWRLGLRSNDIKMRSLGGALTQNDGCPHKKRSFDPKPWIEGIHSTARGSKQGPAMFFSVHKSQSGQRWAETLGEGPSPDGKFPSAAGMPTAAHKDPRAVPPPRLPLSCVGSLWAGRGWGLMGVFTKGPGSQP